MRRAIVRVAIFAIVGLTTFNAFGAGLTRNNVVDAAREVGGELQECSVYFIVSATCIGKQEPALAQTYRQLADQVGLLSLKVGRANGLSDDAFAALGSLHMEAMMDAMQKNCINIAVLLRKYAKFCQRLTKDADPRLKEWMVCKQTRQSPCPGGAL